MRYLFGAYCLDTQRYELHQAGVLIPLRPKVFQVLAYLLVHRERVVPKEELLEQLANRGVRFAAGEELAGWDDAGRLRLRATRTAAERLLTGIDAVIAAVGSTPVNALAGALRGRFPELHIIGDANWPQTVEEATYQGGRVGRLL